MPGGAPEEDLGREPGAGDDGGDNVVGQGPHGGQVTEDMLTGGMDPNTGLEDNPQERYHLGEEHGDEEDLSGLEDEQNLDQNVEESVTDLEQQLQQQGIDEDDYAIRGEGDQLTITYDETGIAQDVADRVLEQNPNADRGDFAVERTDNGGFAVEWGENAGQAEAVDRVVDRVKEQYPGIGTEDFSVHKTGDGLAVTIGDQYRRDFAEKQVRETLEQRYPDADSYQISTEDGEVSGQPVFDESETAAAAERGALGGPQTTEERIEEQIVAQNENLEEGDIEVTPRGLDDGQLEQGDIRESQQNPYEIRLTDQYRQRAEQADKEEFGDIAVEVPGTDKRAEELLQDASDAYDEFAGGIAEGVAAPVAVAEGAISSDLEQLDGRSVGDVIGGGIQDAAEDTPVEGFVDWGDDYMAPREDESEGAIQPQAGEGGAERTVESGVSTAAQFLNVPGVILGAKEAIEYSAWAGSEALAGRGGVNVEVSTVDRDAPDPGAGELQVGPGTEIDVSLTEDGVVGKTGRAVGKAGAGAWNYAKRNPAKTGGAVVGSLVGSYGVMAKAPKSRWLIQPGEEVATRGATAALSRSATGRRILSKFPGNRIDNEEIVIEGGRRALRKARPVTQAARRAKYDLKQRLTPEAVRVAQRTKYDLQRRLPSEVRQFLRDESGQADLTGVGRARSVESEVEGDQTGRTVEVDDTATYTDYETELREQELSQTREMLREQGDAELDARREQLADAGLGPEVSPEVEDVLTTDPTDMVDARSARSVDRSTGRPYRGGRGREDYGMDWSARQVETESATEVEGEMESLGRLETAFDDEMVDTEMAMTEELDQRFESQQDQLEMATEAEATAYEEDYDNQFGFEMEGEAEAELEQELAMEQELEQTYEYGREIENEFELEQEFEMETEAESELPDDPDPYSGEEIVAAASMDADTFDTGFASADELIDELDGTEGDGGLFDDEGGWW
jgi:hypothetical protein